jgi:hypothetical protein
MFATCMYATYKSTFATYRWNTCNIRLEQMKHLELTLKTYMYSYYNICNIPIYFCNIDIQHLQYTSKTSETLQTYSCNMRFSTFFFRTTQHRVGEQPIPTNPRPRMVERPSNGQLRLRLAWARPATTTSPSRLAMRAHGRRLCACVAAAGGHEQAGPRGRKR